MTPARLPPTPPRARSPAANQREEKRREETEPLTSCGNRAGGRGLRAGAAVKALQGRQVQVLTEPAARPARSQELRPGPRHPGDHPPRGHSRSPGRAKGWGSSRGPHVLPCGAQERRIDVGSLGSTSGSHSGAGQQRIRGAGRQFWQRAQKSLLELRGRELPRPGMAQDMSPEAPTALPPAPGPCPRGGGTAGHQGTQGGVPGASHPRLSRALRPGQRIWQVLQLILQGA